MQENLVLLKNKSCMTNIIQLFKKKTLDLFSTRVPLVYFLLFRSCYIYHLKNPFFMQHTIIMYYYSFTSKCNSKGTAKSHRTQFLCFYLIFLFVLYLVNLYIFLHIACYISTIYFVCTT